MTEADPELVLGDEAPAPAADPEPEPVETEGENVFKFVERKAEDLAVLLMKDGRMFVAKIEAELTGLRKGTAVNVDHEGVDSDGVPVNATVSSKASD